MSDNELSDADVEVFGRDWGKNSSNYYGGEQIDSDDDAEFEEEIKWQEQEARHMESKRKKHLASADFRADFEEDSSSSEEGEDEAQSKSAAKKAQKVTTSIETTLDTSDGRVEEIKLSRDVTKLTAKQQAQIVKSEAKEFIPMLKETVKAIDTLKTVELQLGELDKMLAVSGGSVSAEERDQMVPVKSHLLMKKQLLCEYLTKLSFYQHLRLNSSGGNKADDIKSHPVFEHILELRKFVQQSDELDAKFGVDTSSSSGSSGDRESSSDEEISDMEEEDEEISQEGSMEVDDEAPEDSEQQKEEDAEMGEDDEESSEYGLEDIFADDFAEKESKKKSSSSKTSSKTSSSKPAKGSTLKSRVASMVNKRQAFDSFSSSSQNNADKMDLSGLFSMDAEASPSERRKKNVPHDLDDIDPLLGARAAGSKAKLQTYLAAGQKIREDKEAKSASADTNVDFKTTTRKGADNAFGFGFSADEIEASLPEAISSLDKLLTDKDLPDEVRTLVLKKKSKIGKKEMEEEAKRMKLEKKRKQKAEQRLREREAEAVRNGEGSGGGGGLSEMAQLELSLDPSKQRKASKKILKNRGLTRIRPKKDRNVRVKNRRKYDKMVRKRKSTHQEVRDAPMHYGGEMTGLKSGLVKSHKL